MGIVHGMGCDIHEEKFVILPLYLPSVPPFFGGATRGKWIWLYKPIDKILARYFPTISQLYFPGRKQQTWYMMGKYLAEFDHDFIATSPE